MFLIDFQNPDTRSFFINLLSGGTQAALVILIVRIRKFVVKQSTSYGVKGVLYDKSYLLFLQMVIIFTILIVTLLIYSDSLTKNGIILLFTISIILIVFLLIKELIMFWNIGLKHITPTIAVDTYIRSFNSTNSSFWLIGTNAFSFSELEEFEKMLKRIRECRGEVKLLLADPESKGLVEAARNRNCKENLYQNQGRISLGHILKLKERLGLNIEIKLYNAKNIDELPIFRSMFLDGKFCIASIAVYGREDHGKNFPQIFTKCNIKKGQAPKSMYNVVHRYFQSIWDLSYGIDFTKVKEYTDASNNSL
jgi:hypothetical protein